MTKEMIAIYDHTTGENIVREMTDEEQEIRNADLAKLDAEAKAIADAEVKAKAEKAALLEKLGITEDEAKLLLG